MKKTKSLTLLIVYFIWAAGQDLDGIVRYAVLTDYSIFLANGVPWLFFMLAFVVFSLNVLTVYNLIYPRPLGLVCGLAAVVANAIQLSITMVLALRDIPAVREAYVISREARGLPVRDNALNALFSHQAMLGTMVVMLLLFLVIAWGLLRNRAYFLGDRGHLSA